MGYVVDFDIPRLHHLKRDSFLTSPRNITRDANLKYIFLRVDVSGLFPAYALVR